jgi:DNA-binding protein HU-beta
MAGKADVVDRIAELTGMPKTRVALCYDTLFELMGEALAAGDKVAVPNFGTFQVTHRKARTGRNPQTGEAIKIKAKKVPAFSAGKGLKDAVS